MFQKVFRSFEVHVMMHVHIYILWYLHSMMYRHDTCFVLVITQWIYFQYSISKYHDLFCFFWNSIPTELINVCIITVKVRSITKILINIVSSIKIWIWKISTRVPSKTVWTEITIKTIWFVWLDLQHWVLTLTSRSHSSATSRFTCGKSFSVRYHNLPRILSYHYVIWVKLWNVDTSFFIPYRQNVFLYISR